MISSIISTLFAILTGTLFWLYGQGEEQGVVVTNPVHFSFLVGGVAGACGGQDGVGVENVGAAVLPNEQKCPALATFYQISTTKKNVNTYSRIYTIGKSHT